MEAVEDDATAVAAPEVVAAAVAVVGQAWCAAVYAPKTGYSCCGGPGPMGISDGDQQAGPDLQLDVEPK